MDEKEAFHKMLEEVKDSDSDDEMSAKSILRRPASKKTSKPSSMPISSMVSSPYPSVAAPKEESEIQNFGRNVGLAPSLTTASPPASNITKRWLMRPCTAGDPPIQCYVEREKSGIGNMFTTYKLFMEGYESDVEGKSARFLMASKKKTSSRTSYYLISMEEDCADRGSEQVLGKVRGNALGTQYTIYDHGMSIDKAGTPSSLRKVR